MIYGKHFNITPNDGADLPKPIQGLYVGVAGIVYGIGMDGSTTILTGCLAGTVYPLAMRRILASGTTATNLVGLTEVGG